MNIPDIITALGGWGLSVSPDQLAHPTADFVEGVYCACLQQVSGLTYDFLREPVTSSLSSLGLDNEACLPNDLSSLRLIASLAGPLHVGFFQQPYSIPPVRPILALYNSDLIQYLGAVLPRLRK